VERVSQLPRGSGLALPARVRQDVRPAGESVSSRAIQVLLCAIAVALLSPVMLAVALAVRCTSRGPICYRGKRVGKDERVFHILKFRTLVVDAEQRIGARLLKEEDTVYTPIGRFLKKWKLDELPQLFNVLAGSMSLVGPRPHLASELAQMPSAASRRSLVKAEVARTYGVDRATISRLASPLPFEAGAALPGN
jgi:lipopolysaccharide/colanic/teichoic acid biosynthesis glycosyltransferase